LDNQIADGARSAIEELPVILSPEEDVSYWRDRARASREADQEIDLPW
jgi:hypothetical protein